MRDLINKSKQEVIDEIRAFQSQITLDGSLAWVNGVDEGFDYAVSVIELMDTVDAEPIRPEKWIYGEHEIAMCDGYRCSKCDYFVPWDYIHKSIDYIKEYRYCPSCGAKMNEVEE